MPLPYAGAGLPRKFLNLVRRSPFHVPHHRLFLPVVEHLAGHYRLVHSPVFSGALVVDMSRKLETGIRYRPEREICVVEIYEIRIIVVDELHSAVVELVAICLVRTDDSIFFPIPGSAILAQRMILGIEFLWVVSLPPGSCTVFLGKPAIIRHTLEWPLGIAAPGKFIPAPGVGGVYADTEIKSVLAAGFFPSGNYILAGSEVHGVPALIRAVVEVEVIVMVGKGHKILCSGCLVETDKTVRLPFIRLPFVNPVLETEF